MPVHTAPTPSLWSQIMNMLAGDRGWQPVPRPGMFAPVQMRKRGPDGLWLYREPTETEIIDYLEAEAW